MKRIAIALLLVLMASSAAGQTIFQMQTGVVPDHTIVQVQNVTVVATRYNGFYISEAPYGEYNSIWVYSGADLGFVAGQILQLEGEYYEYYDLSEIDVSGGLAQAVGAGPVPPPSVVPIAVLLDPVTAEPWESCPVTIPDEGVALTVASNYGEWDVGYTPGVFLFDDYWYDDSTVAVGDCYKSVTGIINFGFGVFRMNPYADGIEFCPVATDEQTFGNMKAMYR